MTRPRLDQGVQATGHVNTCIDRVGEKETSTCFPDHAVFLWEVLWKYFEIGHGTFFLLHRLHYILHLTLHKLRGWFSVYELVNSTLRGEPKHLREDSAKRGTVFAYLVRSACFPFSLNLLIYLYVSCKYFFSIYVRIWSTDRKIYIFPLIIRKCGKYINLGRETVLSRLIGTENDVSSRIV
jgi:hypothetical protein